MKQTAAPEYKPAIRAYDDRSRAHTIQTRFSARLCELFGMWRLTWKIPPGATMAIRGGKRFIAHNRGGFAAAYAITRFEPCARNGCNLENESMRSHWRCVFSAAVRSGEGIGVKGR